MLRTLKRWFFCGDRLIPEDNRVLFFQRDREFFGFLSNFAEAPLELDGYAWPTVEHYYQAQKSTDEQYHETIRTASTPGWAKRLGDHHIDKPRKYRKQSLFFDNKELLRNDWNDELKLSIMEKALRAEFSQNSTMLKQLLATGVAE